MNLPESLLPENLEKLALEDVRIGAVRTAGLVHRSHYDLGRSLNYLREHGISMLGYRSEIHFAAAELGIQPREAYQLTRIDRLSLALPKLRAAYARGEICFSNMRAVMTVATPESEERWLEPARTMPYSMFYPMVQAEVHVRAERGEAPWPRTGLYGNIGRGAPARRLGREYTPELLELERRVFEKHDRAMGAHTSWGEFHEASLVNYEHELDLAESNLPPHVRETLERDHWRCRVPGCHAMANLEVHHTRRRSQGGSNEVDLLISLCFRHHGLLHLGLLLIDGRAATGFRFAHRACVSMEWTYWPGTRRGPDPCDPHQQAWDIDEMEELEPPRVQEQAYAATPAPYWWLRESPQAYDGTSPRSEHGSVHGSEHVFAGSAWLPPAAEGPGASARASPLL